MATLEDKILGEKLQYYFSSSEDEDGDDNEESDVIKKEHNPESSAIVEPWSGVSSNTGPKGVLKDWQRYKQLESEQRQEQEKEKQGLAKKLALSCRTHLEDEEAEAEKLMDEEFFQQYLQKRMQEMIEININQSKKKFGSVICLETGFDFLDAVDEEEENVTVIVHLYEKTAPGCQAMNGCFQCLAEEHSNIKFCILRSTAAGVSSQFKGYGLPALIVYRGGAVIGSFVRLIDELGDDFYASDVSSFLIEHGFLTDSSISLLPNK